MSLQISLPVHVAKAMKLTPLIQRYTEGVVKWFLEKAAYPSLISDMVVLSAFQLCEHDSKYQQFFTPNFVFEIADLHFLHTESLEYFQYAAQF